MDETSSKIGSALVATLRIFKETSLLMQTIDGLVTAAGYECPYDSAAIWGTSRSYSAGGSWIPTCVSRLWQRPGDKGGASGLLISVELMPDPSRNRLWFDDVGPVVKAIALDFTEALEGANWRLWWRDGAGHDARLFDIRKHGALYHSVPRDTVEASKDGRLRSADNFWLGLTCLTNRNDVAALLVKPLIAVSQKGIDASENLATAPCLLRPGDR